MEHKNFKKCHSRNLDQTDLILDFLSTLDKNKNAGYSWQEEINQINKDWVRMMDGDPGSQDSLDGDHDTPASQYQKNISTSTNQQMMSPSKKVTWSSKLTNVKTISPKHHPPPSAPDYRNRLLKHNQENVNATDATEHVDSDTRDNLTYKSQPKHYHHHHHVHPHHGRSPHKMRLISFVPNGL